jgi:hypothetical protein
VLPFHTLHTLSFVIQNLSFFLSFFFLKNVMSRGRVAKLSARGINGFFLDALQAQYSEVPLCVKTPEGLTAPFMCTVGLKQGEPSSPDLFGF